MTVEVNHMTNCTLAGATSLSSRTIYAKVGARSKTNTKWKKGDGRRGFLPSSPPPRSFLFFALVPEMARAIRFSCFLFCWFVVVLYVLV